MTKVVLKPARPAVTIDSKQLAVRLKELDPFVEVWRTPQDKSLRIVVNLHEVDREMIKAAALKDAPDVTVSFTLKQLIDLVIEEHGLELWSAASATEVITEMEVHLARLKDKVKPNILDEEAAARGEGA